MQFLDYIDTPIGIVEITASKIGVQSVCFVEKTDKAIPSALTDQAKSQLIDYFGGKRKQFDLPLDVQGTDFQRRVWRALVEIEYGQTRSYVDIAKQINQPTAARAVGAANGKNPVSIIVPCHRVIAQDGSLSGYAFGVNKKAWLLNHESHR